VPRNLINRTLLASAQGVLGLQVNASQVASGQGALDADLAVASGTRWIGFLKGIMSNTGFLVVPIII
jgi:hypothetical protein